MDDLERLYAGGGYLFSVYRKRFTEGVFHEGYDPATRFRAGEAALDLIKRQYGRLEKTSTRQP